MLLSLFTESSGMTNYTLTFNVFCRRMFAHTASCCVNVCLDESHLTDGWRILQFGLFIIINSSNVKQDWLIKRKHPGFCQIKQHMWTYKSTYSLFNDSIVDPQKLKPILSVIYWRSFRAIASQTVIMLFVAKVSAQAQWI